MSGDIYGHHNSGEVLLALNGRGQGQDATSKTKNFPAQNVNSAEAENPWCGVEPSWRKISRHVYGFLHFYEQ